MKIKIYQIDLDKDENGVAFLPLEKSLEKSDKINSKIYDLVFDDEVDCENLEDVFRKFNLDIDYMENYSGRSLSVSDIVEVINGEKSEFHYCDNIGFKKVEFDSSLAELKTEKRKITVLMVEPGKEARVEEIDTKLESLQKIVDGLIQTYYPFEDPVCIVCNDEGKIMGLPLNRAICNEEGEIMDIIAGTFIVCDVSGPDFASLNEEQIQKYKTLFLSPQEFFRINGKIAVREKASNNMDFKILQ